MAVKIAQPHATIYTVNRAEELVATGDRPVTHPHASLESLLRSGNSQPVTLIDASVDHSSTTHLIKHETFKRALVHSLEKSGALKKAIGFSSGITLVDASRIKADATHMLEYRAQKLAQEALFITLTCPVCIPNLFTLVGPITYATQGAAWAQVLRARVQGAPNVILNEPEAVKAWVSEFRVFQTVLNFLSSPAPTSTRGALVDGTFTLAEISCAPYLELPELTVNKGEASGWLDGPYIPPDLPTGCLSVQQELLRSLYQ